MSGSVKLALVALVLIAVVTGGYFIWVDREVEEQLGEDLDAPPPGAETDLVGDREPEPGPDPEPGPIGAEWTDSDETDFLDPAFDSVGGGAGLPPDEGARGDRDDGFDPTIDPLGGTDATATDDAEDALDGELIPPPPLGTGSDAFEKGGGSGDILPPGEFGEDAASPVEDAGAEEVPPREDADEIGAPAPPVEPVRPGPVDISQLPPHVFTDYVVREGDSMWSIAADWFGDGSKMNLIAKANPYVDPEHLKIGQALRLPPKDFVEGEAEIPPPDAGEGGLRTYVVKPGDTLSSIAKAYYSDADRWRAIYELNREAIGANPNTLKVGMRLTLPPPGERRGRK